MTLEQYIKMYNDISKMLYDYHKLGMDVNAYCGLIIVKENLESVIRKLANKECIGICWGSHGVSVDNRLA